MRQLWQTLLQADELLVSATRQRDAAAAAQAPPGSPQTPTAPVAAPATPPVGPHVTVPQQDPPAAPTAAAAYVNYPQTAGQVPIARPERRWSVGTVLLVLGAFGLIVAGLIFVTRSWGDLGLAGRTGVLLGVTVVIGALGVWVTARPLRASAEAVWTIFLALLTLDFFAARHEGLAGLGGMDVPWAWIVWGVVALGLGMAIALWARPHVKADLIAPAICGGLGITLSGLGAGAVPDDLDFGWRAIVALIVAGLLALATRPARLRPMTLLARIVFAGFFIAAYVAAFVELADHASLRQLTVDGHGYAMIVMALAALVVARLVEPLRLPAVALAVLGAAALVIAPAWEAWDPEGGWLAVAAVATALTLGATNGTGAWVRGVRLGAVPIVVAALAVQVALLGEAFATIGPILENPWRANGSSRLDIASVVDHAAWVAPVLLVAFLLVTWLVLRWPELDGVRQHGPTTLAAVIALGSAGAVVATRPPVWTAALALLVVAAGLAAAQVRGLARLAGPSAVIAIIGASGVAAASQGVSGATWLTGAAILGVLAFGRGEVPVRQVHAALAVLLGLSGVATIVDLLDVDDAVPALVTLVVALGLIAIAGLRTDDALRLPIEVSAALAGAVALLVPGSTSELAVRWTIVGVALIALSFAVRDRRWYLWPGALALVVAYILLIVDSGFSFVEAYTLPLGAIALSAGLYAAHRKPDAGTWLLLGPGLALALLPSLPQALVDPTDLRALLLGLGAVVVLALGVRMGWQAPFVTGVVIATLLVLFNIGPYANAAPRVVLIAVVSAILLGFGITWEDRVRDGRRLVGYVRSMR
ncbi:hypothetical protein C6I20_06215 [Aeromicrobium sp. A1-2]|nr:hypothetical protein C6I20_06215 [Aeromicrobium sp. A1-2]